MDKDLTTWLIIGGLVLAGIILMTQRNGFGGNGGNGDDYTPSSPPPNGGTSIREFVSLGDATYA